MSKKILALYLKAFIIYESNWWFVVMAIMGLAGLYKFFNGISGWITVFVPIYYAVGVIIILYIITNWKWKQLGIIFKQVKELKKEK